MYRRGFQFPVPTFARLRFLFLSFLFSRLPTRSQEKSTWLSFLLVFPEPSGSPWLYVSLLRRFIDGFSIFQIFLPRKERGEGERERSFSRVIFVKFLSHVKCLWMKRNKKMELYAVRESMYVNGVREISERYEAMTKIHFSRGKLVFRPFLATSLTSTPRPYTQYNLCVSRIKTRIRQQLRSTLRPWN